MAPSGGRMVVSLPDRRPSEATPAGRASGMPLEVYGESRQTSAIDLVLDQTDRVPGCQLQPRRGKDLAVNRELILSCASPHPLDARQVVGFELGIGCGVGAGAGAGFGLGAGPGEGVGVVG